MKLKKRLTLLSLAILTTSAILGQNPKENRPNKEKVRSMKIAYITDKIELTSEEAQKFWPIYNEFDSKLEVVRKKIRKAHKKDISIDEMTDSDVENMTNTTMELRQKDLDIHREFHSKFKTVLSIKKLAKLYKAEHDFKRDLLKKIKNHHNRPPGNSKR